MGNNKVKFQQLLTAHRDRCNATTSNRVLGKDMSRY